MLELLSDPNIIAALTGLLGALLGAFGGQKHTINKIHKDPSNNFDKDA
jgi:hypothetical protein